MRTIILISLVLSGLFLSDPCLAHERKPALVLRFNKDTSDYDKYLDLMIKRLSAIQSPLYFRLVSVIGTPANKMEKALTQKNLYTAERIAEALERSNLLVSNIDMITFYSQGHTNELRVFVSLDQVN